MSLGKLKTMTVPLVCAVLWKERVVLHLMNREVCECEFYYDLTYDGMRILKKPLEKFELTTARHPPECKHPQCLYPQRS